MREYDDITYRDEWISVDEVNKGWSEDKKFHIKTKDKRDLLLRICDVSQYEKKKKEFEIIKKLNENNILMSVAIDYGICNDGKSSYSLYSWINGYDAREKICELNKEQQYSLVVISGKYLKELHSIATPGNIEDWEERFNKKIDRKISIYKACGIILENEDKIILMLLYISSNQISAIAWAKSFGEEEIEIAINQTKKVVEWYDGYKNYIPNWYIRNMKM